MTPPRRVPLPSLPAVAAAWALGVAGVALPLMGHGPDGENGAVAVAVAAAAAAAAVAMPLSLPLRATAATAAAGLGAVVSIPLVGRAPIVLTVVGASVAVVATVGPGRAGLGRLWRVRWSVLVVVGMATTVAAVTESYPVTSAVLGAAVVLLVATVRVPSASRRLDDAIASAAGPVGASVRAVVLAVGRGAATFLESVMAGVVRTSAGIVRGVADRVTRSWRWAVAPEHRLAVGAGVVAAAVTTPIFWRLAVDPSVLIRGTNDINSGIPRVRYMEFWPPRSSVSHVVWFALVRVMAPGVGEAVATTAIGAVSTGAAVVVFARWARSTWDRRPPLPWGGAVAVGVAYLLVENPAVLVPRTVGAWGRFPGAGEHTQGTGYFPLHQWGTPTIVMSLPFVIVMFAWVLRAIDDAESACVAPQVVAGRRRALAALTVLTSFIQPATTLALIAGLPVYLVVSRRFGRRTVAATTWFLVPGALSSLAQVAFLSSDISPYERASWLWRPFWSWSHFGLDRPVFWATLLIPAVCLYVGRLDYLRDPGVALSAWSFALSLLPFLLLEQTTVASVPDGDLGVPPLMAGILWVMCSLRFLALEVHRWWQDEVRGPAIDAPRWALPMAVVLLAFVMAGTIDLLSAIGVVAER